MSSKSQNLSHLKLTNRLEAITQAHRCHARRNHTGTLRVLMDKSAISPLFNQSKTHRSRRALQMHVKGRCFPNRVRRLDMATTTQHDGALFSNTTICIAGRLCITHGESAGPAGPAASPDFQLFFACWFPPRHGKLLCPDPSEPMRWILTRRRRLPLAVAVVLACAPPSVMPSRLLMIRGRRCGCQGASSPSPRIRSNHDAVTANVTNIGPTEQAGSIYDCL